MNRVKNAFYVCKNFILDFLFPTYCINCKKVGPELCNVCSDRMKYPNKEDMEDIYAIYEYHDPIIKKLLHNLKYYQKRNLGILLGKYIYERLIEEISELQMFSIGAKIVCVPVPLHAKKYKERGYNQAEEIAKGLIRADIAIQANSTFILGNNIVAKIKYNLPQAKIKDRKNRLANTKNCFQIVDEKMIEKIKGRTVIVVDDITTTGGTLDEVMKIMKENGAKKVVGFAVAH